MSDTNFITRSKSIHAELTPAKTTERGNGARVESATGATNMMPIDMLTSVRSAISIGTDVADQDAFAILLARMTGLTDNTTYQKIRVTADHIQAVGPDTTERWEEQFAKVSSPFWQVAVQREFLNSGWFEPLLMGGLCQATLICDRQLSATKRAVT